MRWFKPHTTSSIYALLFGATAPAAKSVADEIDLDDIRDSMLACITPAHSGQFPHVARRIRHATNVEALWFLRGDLMAVLASSRGEMEALKKLEEISEMFENLLPAGLRSRPSPLNAAPKH